MSTAHINEFFSVGLCSAVLLQKHASLFLSIEKKEIYIQYECFETRHGHDCERDALMRCLFVPHSHSQCTKLIILIRLSGSVLNATELRNNKLHTMH